MDLDVFIVIIIINGTMQNLKMWIILTKLEIIQNACYVLFSTVRSKSFYIKDV